MQEEDYTFVTLDSDDAILTDAVIVDVDGENDLSDVVMIDESIDVSDFITLSDDTIILASLISFSLNLSKRTFPVSECTLTANDSASL